MPERISSTESKMPGNVPRLLEVAAGGYGLGTASRTAPTRISSSFSPAPQRPAGVEQARREGGQVVAQGPAVQDHAGAEHRLVDLQDRNVGTGPSSRNVRRYQNASRLGS